MASAVWEALRLLIALPVFNEILFIVPLEIPQKTTVCHTTQDLYYAIENKIPSIMKEI